MANKVKFGLSNVHYAPITAYDKKTETYTYGEVKKLPGSVNLTMDPEGSSEPFYADNITFFTAQANAGYSGDLEIAMITDDFRTEILGEEKNADGVMIESADANGKEFALMFQIEGNEYPKKYIMWRCSVGRPSINGKTKEDKITPETDTLNITSMPRENDHKIKGYVENSAESKTVFENWFKEVYQPKAETSGGGETA